MASDATSRPDDSPADFDEDAFADGQWDAGSDDPFADPAGANLFTAEIENVNASDWDDVDTDLIWGDDGGDVGGGDDPRPRSAVLIGAVPSRRGGCSPPRPLPPWNGGALCRVTGRTEKFALAERDQTDSPSRRGPRLSRHRRRPRSRRSCATSGRSPRRRAAPTSPSDSSRPGPGCSIPASA